VLTFVYSFQHHLAYIASESYHVVIATDIRVNRMAGLQRGIHVITLEGGKRNSSREMWRDEATGHLPWPHCSIETDVKGLPNVLLSC